MTRFIRDNFAEMEDRISTCAIGDPENRTDIHIHGIETRQYHHDLPDRLAPCNTIHTYQCDGSGHGFSR